MKSDNGRHFQAMGAVSALMVPVSGRLVDFFGGTLAWGGHFSNLGDPPPLQTRRVSRANAAYQKPPPELLEFAFETALAQEPLLASEDLFQAMTRYGYEGRFPRLIDTLERQERRVALEAIAGQARPSVDRPPARPTKM